MLVVTPASTIVPSGFESLYFQLVPVLSAIVAVREVLVIVPKFKPATVIAQEVTQFVPKQPFELILLIIKAAGCGPKPLEKLTPTLPTKWQ